MRESDELREAGTSGGDLLSPAAVGGDYLSSGAADAYETSIPMVRGPWPCLVCGRGPTAVIFVRRYAGMVVLLRRWQYGAPLCRDHATPLATNWLLSTLVLGWWGLTAFFLNFLAVADDVRALIAARRLAPAGSVIVPGGFGRAGTEPAAVLPFAPRREFIIGGCGIAAFAALLIYGAVFGPKSVGDLNVGDCFDVQRGAGAVISEVPHHPCSQAHTAEVFAVLTYTTNSSQDFSTTLPTANAFEAFVVRQCDPAFIAYTGGGRGLAATVDLSFMAPTEAGWESGNRRVVCFLIAPPDQTLTQSLRAGP